MNTVFKAAGETAHFGWVLGLLTALFLVCFLGWVLWAFAPRNKASMEEAGRMPLTDGGDQ